MDERVCPFPELVAVLISEVPSEPLGDLRSVRALPGRLPWERLASGSRAARGLYFPGWRSLVREGEAAWAVTSCAVS